MKGILDKLSYQNKTRGSKGQVKKTRKPLRKLLGAITRRWGLAARLERRRIKDK